MNGRNTFLKAWIPVLTALVSAQLFAIPPVHAQWSNINPPLVSTNWELSNLYFPFNDQGWAVGRDVSGAEGVILLFQNGIWISRNVPDVSSNWELSEIDFVPSVGGWTVGKDLINRNGVILQFQNGAWVSVNPPNVSLDWDLKDVFIISSNEAWMVGKDYVNKEGVILHYSRGGWVSVLGVPQVSLDWDLSSVQFTLPNEGWAVGRDSLNRQGVILYYLGGTWTSKNVPNVSSNWELSSVHFISLDEGWAVGNDAANGMGVLLHFLNGTWTSVSPPSVSSNWGLSSVHFTSTDEGWAVGTDLSNKRGVILRYLKGTWTAISPPDVSTNWRLSGVHFVSSDEGWAVGSDFLNRKGVILKYSVPRISVSAKSLKYQVVNIGTFLDKTVTVKNSGTANLLIDAIASPALPFTKKTDSCSGQTLEPGQSCKLVYRFAPTSAGTFTSSSDLPSNDPDEKTVTLTMEGTGEVGPPIFIHLINPPNDEGFTACSYYSPPTFQWDPSEGFKSFEVQFSLEDGFSTIPVKAKGDAQNNELLLKSSVWKKVLLLPGPNGGTIYWKVVGTRADKTSVESNVFSLEATTPEGVGNPLISPTTKAPPLPTLSWENNCGTKFKAWFGNDADFSKQGVKKTAFTFSVKNPMENGGVFTKMLTESQWKAIRKLVGDESGSTIYWYVESWDVLKRSSKTGVDYFVLTDF